MSLAGRLTAFASAVGADIKALFSDKVDKVAGKGLSSNDYTDDDKTALASLVSGDELIQQKLLDLQAQIDALNGP